MLLKSSPLSQSSSLCLLLAFEGLLFLGADLPLLIKADISVDDWGDFFHNLNCNSFGACHQSWFPLFSNRPLAPLSITVPTLSLGTYNH
jgi:hypothetical protein